MDNTREIKEHISKAYANGKCDIDGHSIKVNGRMTAKPRATNSTAITYRYRDGKMRRVS